MYQFSSSTTFFPASITFFFQSEERWKESHKKLFPFKIKMNLLIVVFCLLVAVSTCYAQQTIETMWRCGACNENNDCKPFTMNIDTCSPICSPCTGACVTQHYKLVAAGAGTYTLSEYSAAGCLTLDSTVLVESDSCKTGTSECSRVYISSWLIVCSFNLVSDDCFACHYSLGWVFKINLDSWGSSIG